MPKSLIYISIVPLSFKHQRIPTIGDWWSAADTASIEGVKYIRCIDAIVDNSDAISTSSKDMNVINVIHRSDLFGQLPRVGSGPRLD